MNQLTIANGTTQRPDRKQYGKKDVYHRQYARFAIESCLNDDRHSVWLSWCAINRNFYMNNQWLAQEDTEGFFKDTSGQERNRIKVTKNYIFPIVQQYLGNAEAMDITVRAKSRSIKAINRREERLAEIVFWDQVSRDLQVGAPQVAGFVKDQFNIGQSQEQTKQTFLNLYVDEFVDAVNGLCMGIGYENEFKSKQSEIGFDLAMTGVGILKYKVDKGEIYWEKITPEYYIFDHTCERFDHTDAEFKGHYKWYTPQDIFERWQDIDSEDREKIKAMGTQNTGISEGKTGLVPVFEVYWKDYESYKYGYINDEDGYPMLARINHVYEGDTEPRYKESDLISLDALNEYQKKVLGNKKMKTIYVDVIRYAHLCPEEYIGVAGDLLLDYGIMPYQDTEYEELNSAKFPYKTYCWAFYEGNIITPISQLINPQRMINRFASVMENQINNTHGKVLFIDKDTIDPAEKETILSDIYQGKPIAISARRSGVHNAVGEAGSTIDAGITVYADLENLMKHTMENIVGVNDAMKGMSTGPDQLVGVTALQIQRASLIQEPYYKALVEIYKQAHNTNANLGRRVYIDNPRKLAVLVGDVKSRVLTESKQYQTEDFRVEIHREVNHQQQIEAGNQTLERWLGGQLITKEQFAEMYNKSTPEEISVALRKFVQEELEVQKIQAQQQQEQMAMEQQAIAQQQETEMMDKINERNDKLASNQADRDAGIIKEQIKAEAKKPQIQA